MSLKEQKITGELPSHLAKQQRLSQKFLASLYLRHLGPELKLILHQAEFFGGSGVFCPNACAENFEDEF